MRSEKSEITERRWRELISAREEFREILTLLTEFDEKTGRYRRFDHPETHFMRKALSLADPEALRIFLRPLGGFVYHVAAEYSSPAGQVITSWVHEDGIRAEREEFRDRHDHPVHKIRCLTDFIEEERSRPVETPDDLHVNAYTIALLTEDPPGV